MKWYQTLCFACGIAFLAPSFASAQPVPPPPPGQPGAMAPGPKDNHHNDKKHDNKKDDKNAHGPKAPGPQGNHPGPAKPAPANSGHPNPGHPNPGHPNPGPAKPAPPPHSPATPPAPMSPAPMVPPPPPAPMHNPMVNGMEPHDFNNLMNSVKRANFKSDKVNVIKLASHSNYFTSNQVKDLMSILTFDSDRVDVACTLYPKTVDHNNWFMVLDALTFSSSRHEVEICSR